jgi:hypothetical protein
MAGVALALLAAAPAMAQSGETEAKAKAKPIVCGVREDQRRGQDFDQFAEVMTRLDSDKKAGWPASKNDEDLFPKEFRKLDLALLDDKAECSTNDVGRCMWGVIKPVAYRPSNGMDAIAVPSGFPTDLASIPPIAWPFLPPDGPWLKAAVIHDFLYRTCGKGVWLGNPRGFTREKDYDRAEADWILRDAMKDRGVGIIRRNIIWAAVRLGGGGGWGH